MNFQETVEKLVRAETESEREVLLKTASQINILKLARALKDTYYVSWTTEPERVQKAARALQTLVKFNRNEEIKALSFWVSGIANLTQGKLSSAIKNLAKSSQIYELINKEYESAQTQVSKLYALALLGKYDEAIECGENTLKVLEKYGDQLTMGKIEKNLGNIVSRQELHRAAEKYYVSARRRFLKVKNLSELAMCENGLAITYSALNDFRKAEKFYALALNRAKQTDMFVTEAEIEASMGNLALFRGKYDEALKFLEFSRRKYEALQMPHQTVIAELEIADVYLELNLTAEAASIYEKVADELHKLKLQGEEARARANFGRIATSLNESRVAGKQLKKAARLYLLEKNRVGAAAVKIAQANLELTQKNYRTALQMAEEIEASLAASENLRHRLAARLIKTEALRNLGETWEAVKLLRSIFTDSVKFEQPNTAQAAQVALGKIAFRAEDFRQAETHFKRAIRLTETLRAPLAAEEFRMAFLANKLAPFDYLTKIYLAENKLEKAFTTIERARARALAENLESGFDVSAKPSGVLENKLRILREELNWFYSRLTRAADQDVKDLQAEAAKRERQIAEVMRQIAGTQSNRAGRDLNPGKSGEQPTESFKELQKQLGERKALIEFVNLESSLSAFVVTGEKISFAADLARESEIASLLEDLQFQFGTLRYGTENLGNYVGQLKTRADFCLRKLYEKLLAPLEKFLGERALIVVPVGALHYVPFHALFDGAKYLIERREVVFSPSATVWRFLASKPIQKTENALLIGYADERIPFVNTEIESLHKIFRQSKKYTGEKASFAAFMKNAPDFDVLHLACHGNFRPENPLFSSLHLADGWITVRDVCSQKLKAEIVTLSACETGLNKIFAGDEILGLARGFLSAGANSLLLSLWTVNDEAATVLMKNFYRQLQTGKTAAEALRAAQCGFIERGLHPYFWSPFALIGR